MTGSTRPPGPTTRCGRAWPRAEPCWPKEKSTTAQTAFDKVIAIDAEGDLAQGQRTLARLGKARTLVAAKKTDEAIKLVSEVLKAADAEDMPLLGPGV